MGAQLSTTSEGLWLTAALAGVTRLPAALRVRPVGDAEAMIAGHPGLQVLQDAGICEGTTLDTDVAQWLMTLGRCDIELSIIVTRPTERCDRLRGPSPIFHAPDQPLTTAQALEAAETLRAWRTHQDADRSAVLCRRDGQWVAAMRVWQGGYEPDKEPIDEVSISPLETGTTVVEAVEAILGEETPAEFEGINIESTRLDSVLREWQEDPEAIDLTGELLRLGLTTRQARAVSAVCDQGATRAAMSAVQYSLDGPEFAAAGAMVVDTLLGRIVVSSTGSADQRWTMLFPGTRARIARAVSDAFQELPSGAAWEHHTRIQQFHTR